MEAGNLDYGPKDLDTPTDEKKEVDVTISQA